MKNISLAGLALVLAVVAGNASAANSLNTGTMGLNASFTNSTAIGGIDTPSIYMINGRYFTSKDMAIEAGIGISINDSGQPNSSTHTDFGFLAGVRKYIKTEDLAPFIGGRIQYLSTRQNNNTDVTDWYFGVEAGAEYFLAKQFSLEGAVGFGYASSEYQTTSGGPTYKATTFGTRSYNVGANFYF
jgi:Outer membrane protein beta-barrel domain